MIKLKNNGYQSLQIMLNHYEDTLQRLDMDVFCIKNPSKYKVGQKIKTSKGFGIIINITPSYTKDFYGEFYYKIEILIGSDKYFFDERDLTKLWK